jgi:hypothetical protein
MRNIMKLLVLTSILIAGFSFSCNEPELLIINKIWIPKNVQWISSNTGMPEIDTIRKEAGANILLQYDNYLVQGKAALHLSEDSIMVGYEAGIILFKYKDCIKLSEMNDSIVAPNGNLVFKSKNSLIYSGTEYELVKAFSAESKKELERTIKYKAKCQ